MRLAPFLLGYAGLCKLLTQWRNSPDTAWPADAPSIRCNRRSKTWSWPTPIFSPSGPTFRASWRRRVNYTPAQEITAKKTKHGYVVRATLLRPERRGLPRTGSNPAIKRDVMTAQRRIEFSERSLTGDRAEVAFGFKHPGGGPAQDRFAALPTQHAARGVAHPAEQILDQVGRGQHPLQTLGHHGQRLVESFAQRGGDLFLLLLLPSPLCQGGVSND